MQKLQRNIQKALRQWMKSKNRKPLLLRGARQVGKTTAVNEFSKKFDHYIYLNLEQSKDVVFFQESDNVKKILDSIVLAKGVSFKEGQKLLLFIDEIQEKPETIALLRYFYEELNHIYVVAAGSLLELALGKVSKMPVGRIQNLHMHPLNFDEYITNQGNEPLLKAFQNIPISEAAHHILMEKFHQYCILGGMPEVVGQYFENNDASTLNEVYKNIWTTYKSDIEKYGENQTERRIIRHLLETAPYYLDERIKFQNFGNSNYRSREVSEAFRSLDAVGIIRLIFPTTSIEPPLKLDFKKSPRMQFLDIGIVNNVRKIQSELLRLNDLSEAYRGALIPQVIYQELISLNNTAVEKPTFWVRDKTQSSAEVDLVIEHKSKIIPIEIKSGSTGSLKSLHQFINRSPHAFAVRIFGGKLSIQQHTTPEGKPYHLLNLPYYLGTKLYDYIDYFLEEVEK